ncbi:guanine nucleotide exchange protein for ADP-robosylation factor [Salix suchowensis]|nr:guanine nucleotide exchange protein for ADP-robosylation factor [Salix suchowensis]
MVDDDAALSIPLPTSPPPVEPAPAIYIDKDVPNQVDGEDVLERSSQTVKEEEPVAYSVAALSSSNGDARVVEPQVEDNQATPEASPTSPTPPPPPSKHEPAPPAEEFPKVSPPLVALHLSIISRLMDTLSHDRRPPRSMTISKGHSVSVVLVSTALETIAASKEAKKSAPLRESTQYALELVRSNQGADHPREVLEPLRLACETRNEKLMIASLDCISKLVSYSFFADHDDSLPSLSSPPGSPIRLVRLAPRTLRLASRRPLCNDPVNQMVAQGGLTQMVHHIFTRCKYNAAGSVAPSDLPSPQSRSVFSPSPRMENFSSSSSPNITSQRLAGEQEPASGPSPNVSTEENDEQTKSS